MKPSVWWSDPVLGFFAFPLFNGLVKWKLLVRFVEKIVFLVRRDWGMCVCSRRMKRWQPRQRCMLTLSFFMLLIIGQKTHSAPWIPLIRSIFFPLPRVAWQINHTDDPSLCMHAFWFAIRYRFCFRFLIMRLGAIYFLSFDIMRASDIVISQKSY